ncbi:MAG: hypothetical protein AAB225_00675 [Acidobacteriota bacterium]
MRSRPFRLPLQSLLLLAASLSSLSAQQNIDVTFSVAVNRLNFSAVPGVIIAQGQRLQFKASGTVCFGQPCSSNSASPNGSGRGNSGPGSKLPGAPWHSLICGIGGQSVNELFFVGTDLGITASRGGSLYCGMNEGADQSQYNDNTGAWTVRLTSAVSQAPCQSSENNSFSGTLVSVDPVRPTIVLTHGWQMTPFNHYSGYPVDWIESMRSAIEDRLHRNSLRANVTMFTWEGAYRAGFNHAWDFADCHGTYLGETLLGALGRGNVQGIHFIGHSLGTKVNAVAAGFLARNGASNIQFTILDAPIDVPIISPGLDTGYFRRLLQPPEAFLSIDNYYGTDRSLRDDLNFPAVGAPVTGAYNQRIPGAGHSGVHQWYLGTIRDDRQPTGFAWSLTLQPRTSSAPESCSTGRPVIRAVVNAASYASAPLSTGEIVALFGCNLGPANGVGLTITSNRVDTTLASVRLSIGGYAAPLLFVSAGQISAVVPYGVGGRTAAAITVDYQGRQSSAAWVPVAESAPGLFTLDSSGTGRGAVLNVDSMGNATLNAPDNPARRGTRIVLFATGEGETDPKGIDGLPVPATLTPRPRLPVEIQIGRSAAITEYAGGAPSFVSGLLQLNAVVPDDAPSGSSVPLAVTIGRATTQPGVTISVR